jgi:CelD/BcsL family acetyltransferase involved in cellulose biosynthesis
VDLSVLGPVVAHGLHRFGNDAALVSAWNRLERGANLPTQCLAFSAALAGTLLANEHIEIFRVVGTNGVDALLPLCRARGYSAPWRMMGAREVFEPCDALCDDPEGARRLAETVARQPRPLRLDRLPAQSPFVSALQTAMKGKGWLKVRPAMPCPTIALDERWKDPASCFNAGRRSDFRRYARRADEFGRVSYEIHCPAPECFDAMFDEAIGVELRSWKKEAGTAIAADRGKEDFFRDFFRSACARGLFRVSFMRIDGRPVAMQMAVEWRDRYWLFKIGYDENFGKCSPGTLLMLHTLGEAAARGLRTYELLGNVEPWIADFWTRDRHDYVRLSIYPFNARGAIAFIVDAMVWLRASVKRALQ